MIKNKTNAPDLVCKEFPIIFLSFFFSDYGFEKCTPKYQTLCKGLSSGSFKASHIGIWKTQQIRQINSLRYITIQKQQNRQALIKWENSHTHSEQLDQVNVLTNLLQIMCCFLTFVLPQKWSTGRPYRSITVQQTQGYIFRSSGRHRESATELCSLTAWFHPTGPQQQLKAQT